MTGIKEIKPSRAVTKKHAKILREMADRIDRGEIKTLVVSAEDDNGDLDHYFVGITWSSILSMACRSVHSINKTWDADQ